MFLGIGDFARATGLTVKALRWYDEQGVLVPADVDPHTRYRRYTVGQLEQAGLVRALRAAGVPLAAIRGAMSDGGSAHEALRARREAVSVERAREDRALAAAERVLAGGGFDYDVRLRPTPPRAWVGVVEYVVLPAGAGAGADAATAGPGDAVVDVDAAIEAALLDLYASLHADGIAPTGAFWLDLGRPADDAGTEVGLCVPLAAPLPEGWSVPGRRTITGTREAGRELTTDHVVTDDDPDDDTAVHPAFTALVRAAAEQELSIDLGTVRQHCPREVAGAPGSASRTVVELSVDVAE
ncbi:MerR family transcriptional regulator [Embleya scabrispora]|uniref:MerR family transcriptional regulator n=1 Tax=Embleya scabrispora TaxID=159449 RepID=UPI00037FA4CE|nr:MerR family transcriptional regulator [Embleya scabrispora]MYS85901.1 MerR family transcriptional regulator [Streptomyces sp. SID5474]